MALNTNIRGLQLKDSVYGAGLIRNPSDANIMDIDFASIAGIGISDSGATLVLDLNSLDEAIPNQAADDMVFQDQSDGWLPKQTSIRNFLIAGMGKGLVVNGSSQVDVDLDELSEVVIDVAADALAFIDASDTESKKVTIDDLMEIVAGEGLLNTNGVLSVTANITESDIAKLVVTAIADQYEIPTFSGGNEVLADSVQVFLNGLLQEDGVGNDYTLSVLDGIVTFGTPSSESWDEIAPTGTPEDKDWTAVEASTDGSIVLAMSSRQELYHSTDSGVTWNQTQGTDRWDSIAVSGDGSKLLAGTRIVAGSMFLSTNGDQAVPTWTEIYPTGITEDKDWLSVSISADGQTMLAGVDYGGLYLSQDGGTTWNETVPPAVNRPWKSSSISDDGSVLLVVDYSGRIYVSIDGDQPVPTWSEKVTAMGAVNRNWYCTAMSGDGTIMIVGHYGGLLYRSTQTGDNFTDISPNGGHTWADVSMSSDGSVVLAGYAETFGGNEIGKLFLSTNGGDTFTEQEPGVLSDKGWEATEVISDNLLFAGINGIDGGRFYKYTVTEGIGALEEGDLVTIHGLLDN